MLIKLKSNNTFKNRQYKLNSIKNKKNSIEQSFRGDSDPRLPPYQGGALPAEPLKHEKKIII